MRSLGRALCEGEKQVPHRAFRPVRNDKCVELVSYSIRNIRAFRDVCSFCRPYGTWFHFRGLPRTHVLGYRMPPLRGWGLPGRRCLSILGMPK